MHDLLQLKAALEAQHRTVSEELVLELKNPENLLDTVRTLREDPAFAFESLMDLCGVDYLHYGLSEWQTEKATGTGFDRATRRDQPLAEIPWTRPRFAVVYHLLSYSLNHRVRVRVFLEDSLIIPSVTSIWPSAEWYEREAFDLYGILFDGHPDLRRILTDYGFIGHPFRKDFPLSGTVEVRYDETLKRVIYQPVSIPPRTLVPKVIREDSRYLVDKEKAN